MNAFGKGRNYCSQLDGLACAWLATRVGWQPVGDGIDPIGELSRCDSLNELESLNCKTNAKLQTTKDIQLRRWLQAAKAYTALMSNTRTTTDYMSRVLKERDRNILRAIRDSSLRHTSRGTAVIEETIFAATEVIYKRCSAIINATLPSSGRMLLELPEVCPAIRVAQDLINSNIPFPEVSLSPHLGYLTNDTQENIFKAPHLDFFLLLIFGCLFSQSKLEQRSQLKPIITQYSYFFGPNHSSEKDKAFLRLLHFTFCLTDSAKRKPTETDDPYTLWAKSLTCGLEGNELPLVILKRLERNSNGLADRFGLPLMSNSPEPILHGQTYWELTGVPGNTAQVFYSVEWRDQKFIRRNIAHVPEKLKGILKVSVENPSDFKDLSESLPNSLIELVDFLNNSKSNEKKEINIDEVENHLFNLRNIVQVLSCQTENKVIDAFWRFLQADSTPSIFTTLESSIGIDFFKKIDPVLKNWLVKVSPGDLCEDTNHELFVKSLVNFLSDRLGKNEITSEQISQCCLLARICHGSIHPDQDTCRSMEGSIANPSKEVASLIAKFPNHYSHKIVEQDNLSPIPVARFGYKFRDSVKEKAELVIALSPEAFAFYHASDCLNNEDRETLLSDILTGDYDHIVRVISERFACDADNKTADVKTFFMTAARYGATLGYKLTWYPGEEIDRQTHDYNFSCSKLEKVTNFNVSCLDGRTGYIIIRPLLEKNGSVIEKAGCYLKKH